MPSKKTRDASFNISLTAKELTHLRDLFSVVLASEDEATVSEKLAATQKRSVIEQKLWSKIAAQCSAARIPVGDDAPDFVVTAAASPPVDVFEVKRAQEPDVFEGKKEKR